jgi:hypothetical protein
LTALNGSRPNHGMWWRCSDFQQCFRSWKYHWDHWSMQNGTTSKGMEANRNSGKCLSCGRRILGTSV